jgi:hypothetical protein
MRISQVLLHSLLLAMLIGCRKEQRAGARFVAALEQEAKTPYRRCQDQACLEAHEASCRAAHLHRMFRTVEGTPGFQDTYVRPTDGGCEAVEITDYSLDYWGGCRVSKTVCPSIAKLEASDSEECERTVLYEPTACEPPG